jgi:hypothetical protein
MHFPSLRQTYSHVQQEKNRRNALLHHVTHERLAMIDNSNKNKISEGFTRLSEPMLADKEQLKCDYYR